VSLAEGADRRCPGYDASMTDPQQMPAWIDTMSTSLKAKGPAGDRSRDGFIQHLKNNIDVHREHIIDRASNLPPVMVRIGPHVPLLVMARELFVQGQFYACVAMCGIAAERIILDAFKASLRVEVDGSVKMADNDARIELEGVGAKAISLFLIHAGVLDSSLKKPLRELGELRNAYAHASGKNPQADAEAAMRHLHAIVNRTVSVFHDHELRNGVLVRKARSVAR
jgi:hypothetical protein